MSDDFFDAQRNSSNMLLLVANGAVTIEEKGNQKTVEEGEVCLIPAYSSFSMKRANTLEGIAVSFIAEEITGIDIFNNHEIIVSRPGLDKVQHIILCSERNNLKTFLNYEGEMLKILSSMVSEDEVFTIDDTEPVLFREVISEIKENLSGKLRVRDVAKKLGRDPSALSRKFKSVYKVGIKDYIDRLLFDKTVEALINNEEGNIKEIANKFGFCDPYYFSTFFKKHAGVAPSHFLESRRDSAEKNKLDYE